MKLNSIKKLMKIANEMDSKGFTSLADDMDEIISEEVGEDYSRIEGAENVFNDNGENIAIFLEEAKRIRSEFADYALENGLISLESLKEDDSPISEEESKTLRKKLEDEEIMLSVATKGDYGYEDAVSKGQFVVIYCEV